MIICGEWSRNFYYHRISLLNSSLNEIQNFPLKISRNPPPPSNQTNRSINRKLTIFTCFQANNSKSIGGVVFVQSCHEIRSDCVNFSPDDATCRVGAAWQCDYIFLGAKFGDKYFFFGADGDFLCAKRPMVRCVSNIAP